MNKLGVVEDGKWAGWTFVKVVIGGHPDAKVRGKQATADVLDRIVAAGVHASAVLYSKKIGRCYCCNRHLTDQTSRTLGIGPECRKGA